MGKLLLNATSKVICDKPCLVVQYSTGNGIVMQEVPPLERYANDVRFATGRNYVNGPLNNYIGLFTMWDAIPFLRLNGNSLNHLDWYQVKHYTIGNTL